MADQPRPSVSSNGHPEQGASLSGWLPIETAPRDGSAFLAYNPLIGAYHTAFTTRWTGEPNEEGYEGFPCGFWPCGSGSYPFGKWDAQPTHWQALPPNPPPSPP